MHLSTLGRTVLGGARPPVVPTDPDEIEDVAAAIEARLKARPAIVAAFAGGIFRDRAGQKPSGPYLVFKVTSARTSFASDTSDSLDTRIRFACYADDADAAGDLRLLVEAEFVGTQVGYKGGGTTPFHIANRLEDEAPRSAPGSYPYKAVTDFQAHDEADGG